MNPDPVHPIIIVAEQFSDSKNFIPDELLGAAKKIQRFYRGPVKVLIITGDSKAAAVKSGRETGLDVIVIRVPGLTGYNGEIYKAVFSEILQAMHPAYICLPHTSWGMELAPALAIRLNADCITAVVNITEQENRLLFSRFICNDKIIAKMNSVADRTVLTLQPGVFTAGKKDDTGHGSIEIQTMAATSRHIKSMGITAPVAQDTALAGARVIVAAGNGIENQESLALVRHLAACFQKAAIAGSRIICDRGWLGYGCQVGVTGMTVAPDLYIACGISGAAQHVSGMNKSGYVIAINKDPNAAIFNATDIGIVEDLALFIPAFIRICQQE